MTHALAFIGLIVTAAVALVIVLALCWLAVALCRNIQREYTWWKEKR